SIDRTMSAATKNPDKFKHHQSLADRSDNALSKSYGKEVGSTLGVIGGGLLGNLIGRRIPKKNTGILQQAGGTLGGALAGGSTGHVLGSNRDEKRTGFNHEDVLAPYEIADRINNREKFR